MFFIISCLGQLAGSIRSLSLLLPIVDHPRLPQIIVTGLSLHFRSWNQLPVSLRFDFIQVNRAISSGRLAGSDKSGSDLVCAAT